MSVQMSVGTKLEKTTEFLFLFFFSQVEFAVEQKDDMKIHHALHETQCHEEEIIKLIKYY